jgi:arginyl-tRNA synthetase
MQMDAAETIELILSRWAAARIRQVFPDADLSKIALDVVPTADEKFGDYQCNACMALAKQLKQPPRNVAQAVIHQAELPDAVTALDIAGPGFLNFKLNPDWLARRMMQALDDPKLGTPALGAGRTVVLDYSSPNVAKPMHIGHIRSTVIGHALDQLHRFTGYRVIADNHLGDWGTQFGILLLGWKRDRTEDALRADPIAELERIYKTTNAACDADPAQRELARLELVKLQQGDAENLKIWETMQRVSQAQFDSIYQRLGVKFDVTLGESFYNPQLPGVVEDLVARGVARETDGALGVFTTGETPEKDDPYRINKDGEWTDNPCLVRKSDGGFNYATTDLATLVYRMQTWAPEAIIYVTDGRQQLHFRQIFATFRRWKPELQVRLEHVWFGTILGADGKPFKTRSGDTVKLVDLLDEAEERAFALVTEKSPDRDEASRRAIARVVGLGAIKYADLMSNRQNDYVFSWDKMLSLDGNTAPYLQYAYARIASVKDKYREQNPNHRLADWPIRLQEPMERRLALRLARFPDVVMDAVRACKPNVLCDYLFDLAQTYSSFYQNVPFLKAPEGERESRVRLCDLTARTLQQGLRLLGIETLERI